MDDELLPRLAGDGLRTLDLSCCPGITDAALRMLGHELPARHTLQHISCRGCAGVSLVGVQSLIKGCTALERLDISRCPRLPAEQVVGVLPRRRAPEGWEEEEDWTGCATLRTLVWSDAPRWAVDSLRRECSWLEVNPLPDLEAALAGVQCDPFRRLATRSRAAVPPRLWRRAVAAAPER
jgi:hypothetical protein